MITDLLVADLVASGGGESWHWREIAGPVHLLPRQRPGGAEWTLIPGGLPRERKAILHAVERIRIDHPRVRA